MFQEGKVAISQCENCNAIFPVFTFAADTDMVTTGCVALTAPGNRVLLTKLKPGEPISAVEERIGESFRLVSVRYFEHPVETGVSFQEFQKRYAPPEPIYSCISCGGDSRAIETKTKEDFLKSGTIEVR